MSRKTYDCKWFYKKGEFKQLIQRAIADKKSKKHNVFVSRQLSKKGTRCYGSYSSVSDVVAMIKRNGNVHLYETIEGDQPVNLFFDVEFPQTPKYTTEQVLDSLIHYVKKIISETWGLSEAFDDEDVYVSGSIGKGKIESVEVMKESYHIVIHCNSVFRCMSDLKYFMAYLGFCMDRDRDDIPELFYCLNNTMKTAVDFAVYGKNQNMKLPLQSKYGSDRVQSPFKKTDNLADHFCAYYGDRTYPDYYDVKLIPEFMGERKKQPKKKSNRKGVGHITTGSLHLDFKPRETNPEGTPSLTDLDYLVDSIDNTDQVWSVFLGMCFTIKNTAETENKGYRRFLKWCGKSSKFDGDECYRMWNSVEKKKDAYNIGTLIKLAKRCNPKIKKIDPINQMIVDDTKFKTEVYDEKYQRPYDVENYDCIIAESPMGSGKSFQIAEVLKQIGLGKRVLVLSPRRCFARSIASELTRRLQDAGVDITFTCYLDVKDKQTLNSFPYLVCQMESLHLLAPNYNILIADEIVSCLTQFSSKQTMKNNIHKVMMAFDVIWRSVEKKIICDAFIDPKTIEFVENMKHKNERVLFMRNKKKPEERIAIECKREKKEDHLLSQLLKSLQMKKKCVFVTASKAKGHVYIETILKHIPTLTYKFYNSSNKNDMKADMANVNEAWYGVDLLVYTSSITVGVNFDVEYFDELFIYTSCCAGLVRDIFQSSMRVRHLKDDKLYFQMFDFPIGVQKNEVADKKKIIEHIKTLTDNEDALEQRMMLSMTEDDMKLERWKRMPKWLLNVHVSNVFEHNVSRLHHRKMFEFYLQKLNYKIITTDTILDIIKPEDLPSTFIPYEDMKYTDEEATNILHKHEFCKEDMTDYEWNLYQRVKFDEQIKESKHIADIYNMFFDPENFNRQKYYNILSEVKHTVRQLSRSERYDRIYKELTDKKALRLHTIKHIKDILGFTSTTDNTFRIDRETLESKYDVIIQHRAEWNNIFDIREKKFKGKDAKIKRINAVLSPILSKWCGASLKMIQRKRKRVNKKRVDCSIYGIESPLNLNITEYFIKDKQEEDTDTDSEILCDVMLEEDSNDEGSDSDDIPYSDSDDDIDVNEIVQHDDDGDNEIEEYGDDESSDSEDEETYEGHMKMHVPTETKEQKTVVCKEEDGFIPVDHSDDDSSSCGEEEEQECEKYYKEIKQNWDPVYDNESSSESSSECEYIRIPALKAYLKNIKNTRTLKTTFSH